MTTPPIQFLTRRIDETEQLGPAYRETAEGHREVVDEYAAACDAYESEPAGSPRDLHEALHAARFLSMRWEEHPDWEPEWGYSDAEVSAKYHEAKNE